MSTSTTERTDLVTVVVIVILAFALFTSAVFSVMMGAYGLLAPRQSADDLFRSQGVWNNYFAVFNDDETIDEFVWAYAPEDIELKKGQTAVKTGLWTQSTHNYWFVSGVTVVNGVPQEIDVSTNMSLGEFTDLYNEYYAGEIPMPTDEDDFTPYSVLEENPIAVLEELESVISTVPLAELRPEFTPNERIAEQFYAGKTAEEALVAVGSVPEEGIDYDYNHSCIQQRIILDNDVLNDSMEQALGIRLFWEAGAPTIQEVLLSAEPCGVIEVGTVPVLANQG